MFLRQVVPAVFLLFLQTYALSRPEFAAFRAKNLKNADGYRLPGTARPIQYNLILSYTISDYRPQVNAQVWITMDIDPTGDEATYNLQLNSEIAFDTIDDDTFLWNDDFSCELNRKGAEFIEIHCPQPINGTQQVLKITYQPNFDDELAGAYAISYDDAGKQKNLMATQFEPGYARRLMPCFDEPEYKAPIQLTLKTNKNSIYNWVSNTKVQATNEEENGTVWVTFAPTPKMSSYLLAFIITEDFKLLTSNSTKYFSVYARPSVENDLSIALDNGPKLIQAMNNFTELPYVNLGDDQITLAAVPEFSGAMENWGLIIFQEDLLVDEDGAGGTAPAARQTIIQIMAHELSHQWFGDFVTNDWWSDLWLNEGFATYFEYYLVDQILEDYDMMYQLVVREQQLGLKADAHPGALPLSSDPSNVTSDDDFSNEFGDIAYSKGASIVKMLHQTVGDKVFQIVLNAYLMEHEYGNSTPAVLLNILEKATNLNPDIPTLFKSWIYEQGYPIIEAQLLNESNTVSLKATKFLASLNKSEENSTAIWWIPMTYTTSEKPDFDTVDFQWISPNQIECCFRPSMPKTKDAWIVFNLQSAGFYRVNYDDTLWQRLVTVLNNATTFDNLHVLNRAQLLDDTFNIAKYADGTEDTLKKYYLRSFNLTEYLKFETEYHPWYTFFEEARVLRERIQDEETLAGLDAKILEVISPQLTLPKAGENLTHVEALRSNLLLSWACKMGHESCVQWATEQFEKYKTNAEKIDNDYRDVILCNGLANSNTLQADYDLIFKRLTNSTLPLEQYDLLKALTCIKSEEWIQELLLTTIDYTKPPFPRLLFKALLKSLINMGSEKVLLALDFVLQHDYDVRQFWTGIDSPEAVVSMIAPQVHTRAGVEMLQQYITSHDGNSSDVGMVNAAKAAITKIEDSLSWLAKYEDILKSVILYGGGDIPETTTPAVEPTASGAGVSSCTVLLLLITVVCFIRF